MADKFSYEKSMEELTGILTDIDDTEIPIDQLVNKVTRGAELLIKCKKKLTDTETKVKEILNELEQAFGEEGEE